VTRVHTPGNLALVTARHNLGLYSQAEFVTAFERAAHERGTSVGISIRQVRRWESTNPPRPGPAVQHVLEAMFGRPLRELGFTEPDFLDPAPDDEEREEVQALGDLLGDVPARLRRLMRLEESARSVFSYETLRFPGLLQSPRYALAAVQMHTPGLSAEAASQQVRLRLARAESFLERNTPAWFVISEAALYQPIGGLPVLAEQLAHVLTTASRWPTMRIQVLGLDSPVALSSPMMMLETEPGRFAAWLEHLTGSTLTEGADEVGEFLAMFERLGLAAATPDRSLELVDRRRREVCTALETTAYRSGASPATADATTA